MDMEDLRSVEMETHTFLEVHVIHVHELISAQ